MQQFGLLIKYKNMKKQLVSFLVIILIMLRPVHAQLVIYTNKSMSGVWNKYTEKYTYADPKETNIVFKVFKTHITVDDKAGSVYKMVRESKEVIQSDYTVKGFDCKDEKDRDCNVSIIKYEDPKYPSVLIIIYDTIAFMYFIRDFENLD